MEIKVSYSAPLGGSVCVKMPTQGDTPYVHATWINSGSNANFNVGLADWNYIKQLALINGVSIKEGTNNLVWNNNTFGPEGYDPFGSAEIIRQISGDNIHAYVPTAGWNTFKNECYSGNGSIAFVGDGNYYTSWTFRNTCFNGTVVDRCKWFGDLGPHYFSAYDVYGASSGVINTSRHSFVEGWDVQNVNNAANVAYNSADANDSIAVWDPYNVGVPARVYATINNGTANVNVNANLVYTKTVTVGAVTAPAYGYTVSGNIVGNGLYFTR